MYFRQFLEEDDDIFQQLIVGEENVDTIGYHVSKFVFDQFDDNRLGGNTQGGYGQKHTLYSVDSLLGHQFTEDPTQLTNYKNIGLLGGFMYKVNLRLGKTAIININQLRKTFPETDPNSISAAKEFRKWLLAKGFGGVRITGGVAGKLMSNTLVALSAQSIHIRSIKNLKTGTEIKAKDGSLKLQVNQMMQKIPTKQIDDMIIKYKASPAGGNAYQVLINAIKELIQKNPQFKNQIIVYFNKEIGSLANSHSRLA
jgi:hypothetical protein